MPATAPVLALVSVVVVVPIVDSALVVMGEVPIALLVPMTTTLLVSVLVTKTLLVSVLAVPMVAVVPVEVAVMPVVVEAIVAAVVGRGDMIPHPTDHSELSISASPSTCCCYSWITVGKRRGEKRLG